MSHNTALLHTLYKIVMQSIYVMPSLSIKFLTDSSGLEVQISDWIGWS